MAIREKITRRKRLGFGAALACWLAFAVFGVAGVGGRGVTPLVLVAFISFAGCVLFMLFALRCPNCGGNMGYVIQWPPSFWGISDTIRYCPFCGIELDTEETEIRANR